MTFIQIVETIRQSFANCRQCCTHSSVETFNKIDEDIENIKHMNHWVNEKPKRVYKKQIWHLLINNDAGTI